jgi:hypothetical protein
MPNASESFPPDPAMTPLAVYKELLEDKARLDFLESMRTGYGHGVICRLSAYGRGMRLHETSRHDQEDIEENSHMVRPSVREAIDAARKPD